jgi:hypothetical protein
MSKMHYSLEIKAPIEKAFELVEDNQKQKLWIDGLEETIFPATYDRQNPVGTKFKQRIREGGRVGEYDGEVTAYNKPRHLGVRLGNAQFTVLVDYRFTSIAGGTRLEFTSEMISAICFVRVCGALFGWFTRRILDGQMKKLKALAESGA